MLEFNSKPDPQDIVETELRPKPLIDKGDSFIFGQSPTETKAVPRAMADNLKDLGLNFSDFEIVYEPLIRENETPLQFVARLHPGHDWSSLESISWEDVLNNEFIGRHLTRLVALSTKPTIMLRRKDG